MESLIPLPFAAENAALREFLSEAAAQTDGRDPCWFTPGRAHQVAMLLHRGQTLLASPHWPQPDAARQRALYLEHLRRLLPVLCTLQDQLHVTARRLQQECAHRDAARSWLAGQIATE
ncbi:MAG TPA: hypothetical protein VN515_08590 [Terriglobales bacterium]|nr:hypothetical protein [Terriglobales bacterium]